MTWAYLIVMVVVLILGIALAPKPQAPNSAEIDDFDFPTAEEGRPIPVVFGEVDIRGSNILWYGDLKVQAIKKRSGFSKSTVGHKYSIGWHSGLCHGPVDAITNILAGEKQAWTGNVTSNATISINLPDLFGGEKREGGLIGDVDVCMGAPAQTANSYLSTKLASAYPGIPVTAFRGITCLVAKQMYIGTSAYPKVWAVRTRRILKGWLNDTTWYSAKAVVDTRHMNPAHIIYQCLTDTRWGMGVDSTLIDEASFQDVADTLHTENFGMSLIWNQSESIEKFIQIILDHVAGGLTLNNSTGKYELLLIRGDYDIETLDIYDESDVVRVTDYQRQGWGETVNEITLVYTDPKTRKDTTMSQQDMANIDAQEARIPQIIKLKGIQNHTVARTVLARELVSRVTPLSKVVFEINRRAWATRYGGLFKLIYSPRNINGTVYRVLKISKGTLVKNTIKIEALEDIYALGVNSSLATPSNPPDDETPPGTPADAEDTGNTFISGTTAAPPGTPTDGDSYIIPTGATGVWNGHEGQMADWDAATNSWIYTDIPDHSLVYVADQDLWYEVVGGVLQVPPWTPAIPDLTAEPTPALESLQLVVWDTIAEEYKNVFANQVGSTVSDAPPVFLWSYAGGLWYGRVPTTGEPCWSFEGQHWFIEPIGEETVKELLVGVDGSFYGLAGNTIGRSQDPTVFGQWDYVAFSTFPVGGFSGGVTWDRLILVDEVYYTWSRDYHRTASTPADYPIIITSTDGVAWAEVGVNDLPKLFTMVELTYNAADTRWLAFGHFWDEVSAGVFEHRPRVYTSTDLLDWTLLANLSSAPTTDHWTMNAAVAHHGTTYIVGMTNNSNGRGALAYSTNDGDSWSFIAGTSWPNTTPSQGIIAAAYDGTYFLVSGRDWVARSTNASSWTTETALTGDPWNFAPMYSSGLGRTVAGGTQSSEFTAFYSTDAIVWTESTTLPRWVKALIPSGILTTKGDLLTRSSASIFARLGVGTDGQILTADSTEVTGMKWAAAPAGGGGGGGGGGALSFVAKSVVTGSAVTDLTISGLDLDTHERYVIALDIIGATGSTSTISLFFNADTTATNYESASVTNASSATADNSGISSSIGSDPLRIEGTLARNTSGRAIWAGTTSRINGAIAEIQHHSLVWDTSANVTSITVNSSVSAHLGIGTKLTIWKLTASAGSSATPDDPPASANAMDDEFSGSSLDSKWTWVNQGTSTITFNRGAAVLATQADSGVNLRGIEQTVSGTGRWRAKFSAYVPNNFNLFAISLRNTTNSRLWTFYPCRVGNTLGVGYWDSLSSFNSEPLGSASRVNEWGSSLHPIYVEVEITATEIIARASLTGIDGSFVTLSTVTISAFLGSAYDRIGLIGNSQSSSTGATGFVEWFRRMA